MACCLVTYNKKKLYEENKDLLKNPQDLKDSFQKKLYYQLLDSLEEAQEYSQNVHEFVVILDEEDTKDTCFHMKKSYAKALSKMIQRKMLAKVHIILDNHSTKQTCICCNKQHLIYFPYKKTLYAKIPFEERYCLASEWNNEYMKIQYEMLIDILMYLGADNIQFTISDSHVLEKDSSYAIETSIQDISIGGQVSFTNLKRNDHITTGKIVFEKPDTKFDLFFDKNDPSYNKRFYYLSQNPTWINLVKQKILANTSIFYIKITNDTGLLNDISITAKLDKLGIIYKKKNFVDTKRTIEFNIHFFTTINPLFQNVSDEIKMSDEEETFEMEM